MGFEPPPPILFLWTLCQLPAALVCPLQAGRDAESGSESAEISWPAIGLDG